MRLIALFLIFISTCSLHAEVVIQGKINQYDTSSFYTNNANPIVTNPGPVNIMGGVSFTTGVAGGNLANTWRINSVGFNFSTKLLSGPSNYDTYTITGKSLYLYELSGSSTISRYVGSTNNISLVNSSNVAINSISGSFQYVKANLTDWSLLSGQVLENNKTYLLGLNLTGTLGDASGYLNMSNENTTAAGAAIGSAQSGFNTPSSGWAIGTSFTNAAGFWDATTASSDLDESGGTGSGKTIGFALDVAAVPEPSTVILYGLALAITGFFTCKNHKKKKAKQLISQLAA